MASGGDPVSFFHQVRQLLPEEQEIISAPVDLPVTDALAKMRKHGFDQLPVMASDEVLGIFRAEEFANRIAREPRLLKKGIDVLVVEDFVEEVPFLRDTEDIDVAARQLRSTGVVLIGDPTRLLAVITESDLVEYLNRVSRPFTLIREIELGIRSLISVSVTPLELEVAIATALSKKYLTRPGQLPRDIKALTLDEQVSVVVDGRNFPRFSSAFGRHADAVSLQLKPIPAVRNAIFHFREEVSIDDRDMLTSTRNWVLRRCRKVKAKSRSADQDD